MSRNRLRTAALWAFCLLLALPGGLQAATVVLDLESAPGDDGIFGTDDDVVLKEGVPFDGEEFAPLGLTIETTKTFRLASSNVGNSAICFCGANGSCTGSGNDAPVPSGVTSLCDTQGLMTFHFEEPQDRITFSIMDIESTERYSVKLFDANGTQIFDSGTLGPSGSGSGRIDEKTFAPGSSFVEMVLDLTRAGGYALDDITFTVTDTDEDGVPDYRDNCPDDENTNQSDQDLDGIGDACDCAPQDGNEPGEDGTCPGCGGIGTIGRPSAGMALPALFLLAMILLPLRRFTRSA